MVTVEQGVADAHALQHDLQQLTPIERQVVGMVYGSHLSFRQIATTLKLSEPAVNEVISRAMRTLATLLTAQPRASTPPRSMRPVPGPRRRG